MKAALSYLRSICFDVGLFCALLCSKRLSSSFNNILRRKPNFKQYWESPDLYCEHTKIR